MLEKLSLNSYCCLRKIRKKHIGCTFHEELIKGFRSLEENFYPEIIERFQCIASICAGKYRYSRKSVFLHHIRGQTTVKLARDGFNQGLLVVLGLIQRWNKSQMVINTWWVTGHNPWSIKLLHSTCSHPEHAILSSCSLINKYLQYNFLASTVCGIDVTLD